MAWHIRLNDRRLLGTELFSCFLLNQRLLLGEILMKRLSLLELLLIVLLHVFLLFFDQLESILVVTLSLLFGSGVVEELSLVLEWQRLAGLNEWIERLHNLLELWLRLRLLLLRLLLGLLRLLRLLLGKGDRQ